MTTQESIKLILANISTRPSFSPWQTWHADDFSIIVTQNGSLISTYLSELAGDILTIVLKDNTKNKYPFLIWIQTQIISPREASSAHHLVTCLTTCSSTQ